MKPEKLLGARAQRGFDVAILLDYVALGIRAGEVLQRWVDTQVIAQITLALDGQTAGLGFAQFAEAAHALVVRCHNSKKRREYCASSTQVLVGGYPEHFMLRGGAHDLAWLFYRNYGARHLQARGAHKIVENLRAVRSIGRADGKMAAEDVQRDVHVRLVRLVEHCYLTALVGALDVLQAFDSRMPHLQLQALRPAPSPSAGKKPTDVLLQSQARDALALGGAPIGEAEL